MRPCAAVAAFLTVSSAAVLCGSALGAENARDFSGVWQAFTSEQPASRRTNNILSAEGEIKVADFTARYPNMIDPDSYCVPAGMPSTMTVVTGHPIEITQAPTGITMIAGIGNDPRRLFLDDRDYPADHAATRMGYSIGHWEGDTLIVETRLLSEMLTGPFPRTQNTVVVERISKITRGQVTAPANNLINEPAIDDEVLAFSLTVTDDSLYREPQTITVYYQHVGDDAMTESDCATGLWLQALEEANP